MKSTRAPDFVAQKRYLIDSSVQGPSKRLFGISVPLATSKLSSQVQYSQMWGPSRCLAKTENSLKSFSKYFWVVNRVGTKLSVVLEDCLLLSRKSSFQSAPFAMSNNVLVVNIPGGLIAPSSASCWMSASESSSLLLRKSICS